MLGFGVFSLLTGACLLALVALALNYRGSEWPLVEEPSKLLTGSAFWGTVGTVFGAAMIGFGGI